MMNHADALIATFDSHDDEFDFERERLLELLAIHIAETQSLSDAAEFLRSYDLCPIHEINVRLDFYHSECADDQ